MIGHPNKKERNNINYFIYSCFLRLSVLFVYRGEEGKPHQYLVRATYSPQFVVKATSNPRACNFKIGRTTQIIELKSLKTNLKMMHING